MTTAQILIVVGVVVVLAVAAAITWLLVRRSMARRTPPSTLPAPRPGTSTVQGPEGEARDSGAGGVAVAEPPAAPGEAGTVVAEPPAAAVEAAPEAALDIPEASASRLVRLRARLARAGTPFGSALLAVLSKDRLEESDWDDLEETLLLADVGAGPTADLIDALRTRVRVVGAHGTAAVKALLKEELLTLIDPSMDRTVRTAPHRDGDEARPAIVLMVGVNGTGKTTTVGKLARVLVADGRTVLLGAADTFRAAAADQLQTWGERVGVQTVRADRDGADPASVAFDAAQAAAREGVDVLLVDTAGRLQNKAGLMDELGKIKRVLTKAHGGDVDEVLLVLDATTGQNGLSQARVFAEVVDVTGIVLTKLDGTAKGGIVVAVQRELGVPVKLVGLGEGPDDLAPFDPEVFVDALLDG